MNELIKNIKNLIFKVLITLKKDEITYNEYLIAYETYLYIITLKNYTEELSKYEHTIKNLLVGANVEYKDIWEKINIDNIKSELNPPVEEKIPCLPLK